MTKVRAPLTIDAALARIAGQLPGGWKDVAKSAGRKERTARNWGDPDTPEQVPMDCAICLDLAYQEAGGDGAPIFETYAHQLELAAEQRFADRAELGKLASEIILECAEANAAIVAAAQPGACDKARQIGLKEVDEAIRVLKRALPLLTPEKAQPPP